MRHIQRGLVSRMHHSKPLRSWYCGTVTALRDVHGEFKQAFNWAASIKPQPGGWHMLICQFFFCTVICSFAHKPGANEICIRIIWIIHLYQQRATKMDVVVINTPKLLFRYINPCRHECSFIYIFFNVHLCPIINIFKGKMSVLSHVFLFLPTGSLSVIFSVWIFACSS